LFLSAGWLGWVLNAQRIELHRLGSAFAPTFREEIAAVSGAHPLVNELNDPLGCSPRDIPSSSDQTENSVPGHRAVIWRAIGLSARLERITLIFSGFDLESDCSRPLRALRGQTAKVSVNLGLFYRQSFAVESD
jgi:hypothetical protein